MRDGFGRGFGVGLLLIAGAVLGQTAAGNSSLAAAGNSAEATPSKLAFVSATVKVSAIPPIYGLTSPKKYLAEQKAGTLPKQPKRGTYVTASQAEYDYMSLKLLIAYAYNVKMYQISGPQWLDEQRFDVVGKMPDGASSDDAPKMLQALLEDRFKLVVHRKTESQQVMGLMVAKGGPKLQPATASLPPITVNVPPNPLMNRTLNTPDGWVRMRVNQDHVNGTIVSNKITMAGLADLLTNLFQGGGVDSQWQKVVDQTGLTGEYQVFLDASISSLLNSGRMLGVPADKGDGVVSHDLQQVVATSPGQNSADASFMITNTLDPNIFRSIQKLGLKLEISKAPIEMLVVDHAEKNPTAN